MGGEGGRAAERSCPALPGQPLVGPQRLLGKITHPLIVTAGQLTCEYRAWGGWGAGLESDVEPGVGMSIVDGESYSLKAVVSLSHLPNTEW